MPRPKPGDTYTLTRPEGWGVGPGMLFAGTVVTVREVVAADEPGAHDDSEDAVVIEWGETAPVVASTGEREPTEAEVAEFQARVDAGELRRVPRLVPEHTVAQGTVTRALAVGLDDFAAAFERRTDAGQVLLSLIGAPFFILWAALRWLLGMPMVGEPTSTGAGIELDAMTGRATQTARSTYLTFTTAAVVDADTVATIAEISTAGHARQVVTWTAPAGDPRRTDNSAQLTFGPYSADPPNIPYAALVSSSSGTGGDCLHGWTLDAAKDAAIGESILVAVGALAATQD